VGNRLLHRTRNRHFDESMVSLQSTVSRTFSLIRYFVCPRRVEARDIHTQRQFGHQQVRSSDCPVPNRALTLLELDAAPCLGGWWTRPSNWKANTFIAFAGIIGATYGVWNLSADKEVRACYSFFLRSHPPSWFWPTRLFRLELFLEGA
jgi:hypothetical protein